MDVYKERKLKRLPIKIFLLIPIANQDCNGARGVSICKEWDDFETFKKWAMDNGYNDTLSIDRINVNGDYSPNNCRWANSITQNNNRRTNHYVTHNEETHTVAEWARILDVPYKLLHKKIMKYGENIIGKYLK